MAPLLFTFFSTFSSGDVFVIIAVKRLLVLQQNNKQQNTAGKPSRFL